MSEIKNLMEEHNISWSEASEMNKTKLLEKKLKPIERNRRGRNKFQNTYGSNLSKDEIQKMFDLKSLTAGIDSALIKSSDDGKIDFGSKKVKKAYKKLKKSGLTEGSSAKDLKFMENLQEIKLLRNNLVSLTSKRESLSSKAEMKKSDHNELQILGLKMDKIETKIEELGG
jgi:hypothetical protein